MNATGNPSTRLKILVAAALFIFVSALLFWKVVNWPQRVEFADGLTLEWLGVTNGTNTLMDGSLIERLLGDRLPAGGMEIGRLTLRRPTALRAYEDEAALTAWIRVKGAVLPRQKFGFYWEGSRVVTTNSSGREIDLPPARPFGARSTNEAVIYIPLYAFPRSERNVRLRVSPPRDDREERRWAEFEFENPFYGKVSNYEPSPLTITNVVGDHEFVLTDVRTNPARLVFRMPATNWYAAELYISDEEGNRTPRIGRRTRSNGREQTVEHVYGLEGNRTWKISATFVAASSKTLMGSGEVNESDLPAARRFLVSLGAGGEAWLTNANGTAYRCRFDGETVSIGKPGAKELPYFVVLGATNGAGEQVPRDRESMGGGGLAWRSNGSETVQVWSPRQRCTNLVLHLALPTVVRTEFYVHPGQERR